MKIIRDLGLFRQVEEYEYEPTLDELYHYYRGTHAGFTRDNPYANSRGRMTTHRLIKVTTATSSDSGKQVKRNQNAKRGRTR